MKNLILWLFKKFIKPTDYAWFVQSIATSENEWIDQTMQKLRDLFKFTY